MSNENQVQQKIERVENVIYNSLTANQYYENTSFKFERINERKTKLFLNITKYGLVSDAAIKKMFKDIDAVFGLENVNVSFDDTEKTMEFFY